MTGSTNPMLTASCADDERRLDVAATTSGFNGIDVVEIDPTDQRILTVGFLHPLPGEVGGVPAAGAPLTDANVVIEGGERIVDISVTAVASSGANLTVTVDRPGDFSPYVIRIVTSAVDDAAPTGFDPALSARSFTFKAGCPSLLDCRPPSGSGQGVPPPDAFLDHLARDDAGFRRLMLDRMSTLVPDFRVRHPADLIVTVTEALAHAADARTYRQDVVAAEAHLGTARSRVSVRRHVRLLDYDLHDGAAARTWVCVDVEAGSDAETSGLPAGTVVMSAGPGPVALDDAGAAAARQAGAVEFETLHAIVPRANANTIAIHTWGGTRCHLPEGATAATLVDPGGLVLAPGDPLLLIETRNPVTGRSVDADPGHRQVVRLTGVSPSIDPVEGLDLLEVEWSRADALGFDLHVTTEVDGSGGVAASVVGAVAKGNIVVARHGRATTTTLATPRSGRWRPVLTAEPIAAEVPYDPRPPASSALAQDPGRALPVVTLTSSEGSWSARRDLLAADRFDRGFVVEIERDGVARLRFGDDTHGRRPAAGIDLVAHWYRGGGRAGNIGRDVLGRIVAAPAGIVSLTNPVAAEGGDDPETLEHARQHAPAAFVTQERAVTEADWVEVALRQPEVQDAVAHYRWTGSWWTVFVTLDLFAGVRLAGDPALHAELRRRLDRFRIAGYDLELRDPRDLPIDLTLRVCVEADHDTSAVRRNLAAAFSTSPDTGTGPGMFHPDQHTIGGSLHVSRIVARAAAVPGVRAVEVTGLRPVGIESPPGVVDPAVASGVLVAGELEIVRLDSDPSFPEHGMLHLELEGGR